MHVRRSKPKRHCPNAAVFYLETAAAAAAADEHWRAAAHFGGQIIQIGCRCVYMPQTEAARPGWHHRVINAYTGDGRKEAWKTCLTRWDVLSLTVVKRTRSTVQVGYQSFLPQLQHRENDWKHTSCHVRALVAHVSRLPTGSGLINSTMGFSWVVCVFCLFFINYLMPYRLVTNTKTQHNTTGGTTLNNINNNNYKVKKMYHSLFVCKHDYAKSSLWISPKLSGRMRYELKEEPIKFWCGSNNLFFTCVIFVRAFQYFPRFLWE